MKVHCVALLAFAHVALASIFPVPKHLNTSDAATVTRKLEFHGDIDKSGNSTQTDTAERETNKNNQFARRARVLKARRSTSSSSGERYVGGQAKSVGESLGVKSSDDSNSGEDQRKKLLGGGWRKWHRRCTPCPDDMAKKWRDPTIKWICGGYQRARRSFKSECMMYYRNCQDGTMFVKLRDFRCDDKVPGYNGGKHFLYDYPVKLPDDTSGKSTETEQESTSADDDDSNKKSSDTSGD